MSAAAQQIAQTSMCECEVSASDVSELVDVVRNIDKTSEGWKKVGCLTLVLGVPMLFPGALILSDFNPVLAVGAVVTALILIVSGIVLRVRYGKTDYENRRYELLLRLANLLKTDMAPDAGFHLKLDLRPQNHKQKYLHKGKVGRWDVKFYEDPWLCLSGRLLDGTHFQIDMLEKHQARRCSKRSASGKTKIKTKTKNSALATVSLRAKQDRYPGLDQIPEVALGAVQVPNWAIPKRIVVEGNQLLLKASTKQTWNALPESENPPATDGLQLVASMLLSLYQILNLTRQIDKSKGSES